MKKETISFSYSGSGIKTTRAIANTFLIISILLSVGLFIAAFDSEEGSLALYALISILSGFLIHGPLCSLATIAENSLINSEQQDIIISLLRNNHFKNNNDEFEFLEKSETSN